jgi:hypothetical protein
MNGAGEFFASVMLLSAAKPGLGRFFTKELLFLPLLVRGA